VFLAANHFPWGYRYRPELTPQWRDLGNQPKIDEYLRRQTMSARDYAAFLDRLKREFPGEAFLLVRYGDHQPEFAMNIIDPALDEAEIGRRIETLDPRYLTTRLQRRRGGRSKSQFDFCIGVAGCERAHPSETEVTGEVTTVGGNLLALNNRKVE